MKKLIMTLSIILVCAVVEARAQTCVTPPDCGTLGYNKTTADCAGLDMLACPFDTSKVFCTAGGGGGTPSSEILPGMIVYSDGSITSDVVAGKTPVGVVAYVNGTIRFMIALEENSLKWGPTGTDLPCVSNSSTDMIGLANTRCIMEQSGDYPAAKYCSGYKPVSSGTGSSGWYLPAAGELAVIKDTIAAVDNALQRLNKTLVSSNSYLSSSEYNNPNYNTYATIVKPSTGNTNTYAKDNVSSVRCVLAF